MQTRAALLGLLLVAAPLLAGCLADAPTATPSAAPAKGRDPLTTATHTLGSFLSEDVPAYDGVPLHIDVQLPNGSGPFPTLIQYTPYSSSLNPNDEAWGETSGKSGDALASEYVPYGYAVAIAHVRGSGQSGGCFSTGGPDEARDGYSLVEWVANQSWSSKKVALMGTSYVGTTPISTATLHPPHLTTIVPVSGVSEWYRYYFENGVPRFFGELPFGVVYTDQPIWAATGLVPKPRDPVAYAEGVPGNAQCGSAQMQEAYAKDSDYDAYWMARDYVKDLANATAPMLYAHGFLDENTPTSLVTDFLNAYPGEKRAWLQQHGHGVPASFKDYHAYVHRWLDHWMLGRDNGAMDLPPVVVEDNRGKYHNATAWPPADAHEATFWLGAGGKLADAPPASGSATYTDDPRAVQEVRDANVPADGTFLRFESAPLAAPLHLSGAPRVNLTAASSATSTQWDVLLFDEAPDGTSAFITRGYLDARHREGLDHGVDVIPGKDLLYAWPMHSRDFHVDKGHRLVLTLASSDKYVLPDKPGATNTVKLGPSLVTLPVVDLPGSAYADAPPSSPS